MSEDFDYDGAEDFNAGDYEFEGTGENEYEFEFDQEFEWDSIMEGAEDLNEDNSEDQELEYEDDPFYDINNNYTENQGHSHEHVAEASDENWELDDFIEESEDEDKSEEQDPYGHDSNKKKIKPKNSSDFWD